MLSTAQEEVDAGDRDRERGHYEEAIEHYANASKLLYTPTMREVERALYGYCQHMTGVCQARLGAHETALLTFELAWSEYGALGDDAGIAKVLRDEADSKVKLNCFDDARKDLIMSSRIFHRLEMGEELVANDHFMARLQRARGDFLGETVSIEEAYRAVSSGLNPPIRLYVALDYASMLVRDGRTTEARKVAAQCFVLALRKRAAPHAMRALKMLFWAHKPETIRTALFGRSGQLPAI